MTVPNVSKLRETQGVSLLVVLSGGRTDLVLIYFPSLVRSLSEVAFSEPARSMRLCKISLVMVLRIRGHELTSTEVCTLLPPLACNLGPPRPGVCLPPNPGVCRPFKPGVCRPFMGGVEIDSSSSSSTIEFEDPRSRLSTTSRKTL